MNTLSKNQVVKLVYEKPMVRTIQLRPGETLAAGCKMIPGRNFPGNINCGTFSGCNKIGS
jgi:hypothetical protein